MSMHLKKKKIVKKFEKNKSKGRKSGSNDFGIIQFIMQYLQNSTVYNVHILGSEYSTSKMEVGSWSANLHVGQVFLLGGCRSFIWMTRPNYECCWLCVCAAVGEKPAPTYTQPHHITTTDKSKFIHDPITLIHSFPRPLIHSGIGSSHTVTHSTLIDDVRFHQQD